MAVVSDKSLHDRAVHRLKTRPRIWLMLVAGIIILGLGLVTLDTASILFGLLVVLGAMLMAYGTALIDQYREDHPDQG